MNASLEDLSQVNVRTGIRITCVDGNQFEMPVPNNTDVTQFMGGVKGNGFIGCQHWYVNYDAIIWAVRVVYHDNNVAHVEGMTKQ